MQVGVWMSLGLREKRKDWTLVLFGPCWPNLGLNSDLNGAQKRGGIGLGLSRGWRKRAWAKWVKAICSFASEHFSMFWLSFLPRMSDRYKINFFRESTYMPFQPYMARFLIQSQEIMVNFSITYFCSVLAARPPCSKSDATPSRKMIKM